jgi:hypothetical protein
MLGNLARLAKLLKGSRAADSQAENAIRGLLKLFDVEMDQAHWTHKGLRLYSIGVASILGSTSIVPELPVIVSDSEVASNDIDDILWLLKRVASRRQKRTAAGYQQVCLVLASQEKLSEQTRRIEDYLRENSASFIVILSTEHVHEIIASADPKRSLRRTILSKVDRLNLSPFITSGPVPERLFFGRESDLRRVAKNARRQSFAVIGGRRIGKSSFLLRLHHVRLPAAGFRTLFYYCSTTPTYESFLAAATGDWRPERPSDAPATLGDLLQSPPTDKPLVLLLDEADALVPADRTDGWRLFNTLRAMVSSGNFQVVLSGERTLRYALRDPTSPLFNLANEVLLGPLDFHDVEELVTRPMEQLEIQLVDEAAIVRHIWDLTSGHPNVVQRLCHCLIEQLDEQGTHRITLDDVNAVVNDPRFQEEDFLKTYWERATPLEKIISLLMVQQARPHRLQAILDLLAAQDLQPEPQVVKAALDRLVDLRSILKRSRAGYEFAVEAFPLVVANSTTAEDLLIVFKSLYLKNPQELIE